MYIVMNLEIKCDSVNIETRNGINQIILSINNPDLDFLGDIKISDLIKGYDNRELFDAIIENDEDILKDYLADNGYKIIES